MTKTKTATKATKTTTPDKDTTTRAQRNIVRKARDLKAVELKAYITKHREAIRAVAATTRPKLSAEAKKLLSGK